MEEKKQKLVLDGNAFYELDLECLQRKELERRTKQNKDLNDSKRKRQRG